MIHHSFVCVFLDSSSDSLAYSALFTLLPSSFLPFSLFLSLSLSLVYLLHTHSQTHKLSHSHALHRTHAVAISGVEARAAATRARVPSPMHSARTAVTVVAVPLVERRLRLLSQGVRKGSGTRHQRRLQARASVSNKRSSRSRRSKRQASRLAPHRKRDLLPTTRVAAPVAQS